MVKSFLTENTRKPYLNFFQVSPIYEGLSITSYLEIIIFLIAFS